MSGIKTSVKLGKIEFTFYPDLLELAQSSDYSVIEPQSVTQEVYHGHQFLHIRKVASDKICKLRQLAVLLFVSVSYLLYLFVLCRFDNIHFSPFTSIISSVVSSFISTKNKAVKQAKINRSRTNVRVGLSNSCAMILLISSSVRYSRSLTFGLIWNCANGFLGISPL